MSEPGRPDDETIREMRLESEYQDAVPDESRRIFTEAGINSDVKAIFGRTSEVQPTEDGKLSDSDKQVLLEALQEAGRTIEGSSLDDAKKTQARNALNRFIDDTDVQDLGSLGSVLYGVDEDADPVDEVERLNEEDKHKEIIKRAGFDEEDVERSTPILADLKSLARKETITDAEAIALRDRWTKDLGLRRSQVEILLEATN